MGNLDGAFVGDRYTEVSPASPTEHMEDMTDKKKVLTSLLDVFLEAAVEETGGVDTDLTSPHMTQKLIEEIESFLIQLSTCYQSYGCPTHIIEMTMIKVAKGLGVDAQFLVFPSHTIIEISNIKTASGLYKRHSQFFRTSTGFNFYKLQLVDELARRISSYAEDIDAANIQAGQVATGEAVEEAFERARAFSSVQNREARSDSMHRTYSGGGSGSRDAKADEGQGIKPDDLGVPTLDELKIEAPPAPFYSLLPRLPRFQSQYNNPNQTYAQSLGKIILDLARLGPNIYAASDKAHSGTNVVSSKIPRKYRNIFSKLAVEDGNTLIRAIVKQKPLYSTHFKCFLLAVASFGCAGIFFGGSWTDMVVSFFLSWLVAYMDQISSFAPSFSRIYEFAATFVASIIIRLINQYFTPLCYRAILMSTIVFSLQGVTITMAFIDLLTRDLVSGTTKLFYGMLISAIIGFGMDISTSTYAAFAQRSYEGVIEDSSCVPGRLIDPNYFPLLFVITSLSFNVLLESHVNQLVPMLVISAFSYAVYYFLSEYVDSVLPVVLASFTAACLSNLYSRFTGHPSVIYIITAVILLVPGSVAASSFFNVLTLDLQNGLNLTFSVVTGALAIAIGVFGASAVVQVPDIEEFFSKTNSLYPGPKSKSGWWCKRKLEGEMYKTHKNSALSF